jgi:hypothetical protein
LRSHETICLPLNRPLAPLQVVPDRPIHQKAPNDAAHVKRPLLIHRIYTKRAWFFLELVETNLLDRDRRCQLLHSTVRRLPRTIFQDERVREVRPHVLRGVILVRPDDDLVSLLTDHDAIAVATPLEILDVRVQEISQTPRAGFIEDRRDGVAETWTSLPDNLILIPGEGLVVNEVYVACRSISWKRGNVSPVELAHDRIECVFAIWISTRFVLKLVEQVVVLLQSQVGPAQREFDARTCLGWFGYLKGTRCRALRALERNTLERVLLRGDFEATISVSTGLIGDNLGLYLLFLTRPPIQLVVMGVPHALHRTALLGCDRARGT